MNAKGITMKTTRKRTTTRQTAAEPATVTAEWLTQKMRNGRVRIEVLGWKKLARIYYAHRPGSRIRKAINAECRRCGYTPRNILALHAE